MGGMPGLPPVLALEALAQVASVLAGRPVRRLAGVAMESPVLIPSGGEAAVRICALRDGETIVAALRCADSSYLVDHARAEFSVAPQAHEMPEAAIAAASPALEQLAPGPTGLVDGTELYGPISFQSGRFRRIALMPEVTAKSGRALARGADDQPWFTADGPFADSSFLLGSPGLNDAVLQVLQACVPHRGVRPAGCESVQFSGRIAEGPVEIRAVAEPARVGRGLPHVPSQAMAPASEMAAAAQANGAVTGAGPLAGAADVGGHPDADLSAEQRADQELTERPPHSRKSRRNRRRRNGYVPAQSGDNQAQAGSEAWEVEQCLGAGAVQSAAADRKAPAEGRHAGPERRALNTVKAPGVGALAGFGLMLRAPVPVACGWVTVQPGHRHHEPAPGMASAF